MTVFCLEENRADKNFSATTAIAGILTFALGAYALLGDMRVGRRRSRSRRRRLLAMRERLHGWVQSVTWPELRSGLVLLAMTFIALPLVPDDPVGPFGGVNPREVWLIAIVLAGVSFLGYAAVKYFGERHGVLLAAAAGGLVSSTAVTLANARRAADRRGLAATAGGRRGARNGGVVCARPRDRRGAAAEPARAARAAARRSGRGRGGVRGLLGLLARGRGRGAHRRETPQPVQLSVGDRTCAVHGRHHPARALPRASISAPPAPSSAPPRSGCSTSMR